jgi:hypothetical protein
MNAYDLSSLSELAGFWSCLSVTIGLAGVCVCRFSPKAGDNCASFMFLLGVFIAFYVLPASKAYSGAVPSEIRAVWQFDKYFATQIAFVFVIAFAFDSPRYRIRRCFAGLIGAGLFLILSFLFL